MSFQNDWKTIREPSRLKREYSRKPGVNIDLPGDAMPLQVYSKTLRF